MKNNKGFLGLGLILAIVAVLVVGGGAYYLGTKNSSVPKNAEVNNNQSQTSQNNSHEVPTGPFGDETNYVPPPRLCKTDTAPWIQVTSPNGGETFKVGDKVLVKWKTCNLPKPANIDITLAKEPYSGKEYGNLISNGTGDVTKWPTDWSQGSPWTDNDGQEYITIPPKLLNTDTLVVTDNYKINIEAAWGPDVPGYSVDNSSGEFKIIQ